MSLACAALIAIVVFIPSIGLTFVVDPDHGSFQTLSLIPDVPGLGAKYLGIAVLLAALGAAARGWVSFERWAAAIPVAVAVIAIVCMATTADVSDFCSASTGGPCTGPFSKYLNGDLAKAVEDKEPENPAYPRAVKLDGRPAWWVLYAAAPILLAAALFVVALPMLGGRAWPMPFLLALIIGAVLVLTVALAFSAGERHGFVWN